MKKTKYIIKKISSLFDLSFLPENENINNLIFNLAGKTNNYKITLKALRETLYNKILTIFLEKNNMPDFTNIINDINGIKNNVNMLKNNINNIICYKGVNKGNTLYECINNVNYIYEDNPFTIIGYDKCPNIISENDINYSKEIKDNWYAPQKNLSNEFANNFQLKYMPFVDTSNATNMNSMFQNCNNLTTIPQLDTSNVTDMGSMFDSCYSLTTIPQLDTSNVTDMGSMFGSCYSLTTIPQLDTSNVTHMTWMFNYCRKLTTIPQLDTSNVINMSYMFNSCSSLAFINILNLGTQPQIIDIDFRSTIWGDDSKVEGSKQSLIDSLITNSFNRAKVGYTPCTLRLSETTKGFLTEAEKKSITDKGYTLA